MAHGFSANSLKAMEDIFDRHINSLRVKVDKYADSGEVFDLKEIMSYYGNQPSLHYFMYNSELEGVMRWGRNDGV